MVYKYDENDFVYETYCGDSAKLSRFDEDLQTKWLAAVDKGYFRYRLNILDTKRLPGQFSFLAQLNPDRAVQRRPPEDIRSLTQPFDANKFNFTKIGENEILFELEKGNNSETDLNLCRNNIFAINISPLGFGHSLFIPEVSACLPQILTLNSLHQAFEILLLSGSAEFRAGFNSLCGYATVNHLHVHFYYLSHRMLLENIKVEHLSGLCYVLKEYPAKAFAFQLNRDHDVFRLASSVYKLTNYLQTCDVAHNVYITRGCFFETPSRDTTALDTLRVYVWARKHSIGAKNVQGFDPAICELFGHLMVKAPEPFSSLTEDVVADVLCSVCQEPFDQVCGDVHKLFQEESPSNSTECFAMNLFVPKVIVQVAEGK